MGVVAVCFNIVLLNQDQQTSKLKNNQHEDADVKRQPMKAKSEIHRCPDSFPDVESCRVKQPPMTTYFECLSVWANKCEHCVHFANRKLCHHSSATQILAWTEQQEPSLLKMAIKS